MKQSKSGSLNINDIKKWGKNILVFSSPLLIIFLTAVQNGMPIKVAALLLYAALIQAIIDLLKKYIAGN